MGYTRPGTSKFSLGVDTSAESLKSDVKKNITKDSDKTGKLGVNMTFDHNKIKKDAKASALKQSQVDKDRHAKLTKLAGGYTDVNVIPKERSQETKDAYAEQIKIPTDTRQNQAMLQTTKDLDAGKLKNIARGRYTGDMTTDPTVGSIIHRDDKPGNFQAPVSGTSTTQKGIKGSSEVYTFEQDIPDAAPRNKDQQQVDAKMNLEPGDYRYDELVLGKTPKLTGKQKRQAKRKTNKAARLKKQGERTDAKIMKNNPEFKGLSY